MARKDPVLEIQRLKNDMAMTEALRDIAEKRAERYRGALEAALLLVESGQPMRAVAEGRKALKEYGK